MAPGMGPFFFLIDLNKKAAADEMFLPRLLLFRFAACSNHAQGTTGLILV